MDVRIQIVEKNIRELLEQEIIRGELPGAAVGILHHGEIMMKNTYGFADISSHHSVKEDSIFRLYSLSKPVAAIAAMKLWEKGKLDFLSPVYEYLPEFREMYVLENGECRKAQNTMLVLDLMRMTSGVVYPDPDPAGKKMGELFTQVQSDISLGKERTTRELCRMVAAQPLAFEPGSHWRYGFSADIVGAIVEVVSGKKLGNYYQEEIFMPLGMADTAFYVPTEKQDRLVQLYTKSEEEISAKLYVEEKRHLCLTLGLTPPSFESAGAGLYSTLLDYMRFAGMLSMHGVYKNVSILGKKAIDFLTHNQMDEVQQSDLTAEHMKGYGYGNLMRIYQNHAQSGTSGSIGEFGWDGWTGAYFTANTTEEFAIVLMLQRAGYVNPKLIRKLRNAAYNLIGI